MDINKFKPIAARYISDNFGSREDASRYYGHHRTYLNRCFNGQRPFPDSLLSDMGWQVERKNVYSYTKKKEQDNA